jgi:hypothetical protein
MGTHVYMFADAPRTTKTRRHTALLSARTGCARLAILTAVLLLLPPLVGGDGAAAAGVRAGGPVAKGAPTLTLLRLRGGVECVPVKPLGEREGAGVRAMLRQDTVSPFDVSELKSPPYPQDSSEEEKEQAREEEEEDSSTSNMDGPRMAKGIRAPDLVRQEDHGLQDVSSKCEKHRKRGPAGEEGGFAESCLWCNAQHLKDVKLLMAARVGDLEGVLEAIQKARARAHTHTHIHTQQIDR